LIKDSGSRTEFSTGAVRDVQALEKGRCDLLPLDVVKGLYDHCGTLDDKKSSVFGSINKFMNTGDCRWLYDALLQFCPWESFHTMFLEVAIHMAEGCQKYGERNWQKGIPLSRYIDSGVRHYLKWLRRDKDEPHDRAFCWNIMCGIWTCHHKPELNDYAPKREKQIPGQLDLFEDDLK
jgi:hypothetical protein